MKKFCYKCRKHVADKRLRIKGRFVTKEQAFEILGLSQEELLDNDSIQQLLTQLADDPVQLNSVIESIGGGGQTIKIRNFQALIDKGYTHNKPESTSNNDASRTSADQESGSKNQMQLNLRINTSKAYQSLMKFLNNGGKMSGGRLEVLNNHIPPVFRIEKVSRGQTIPAVASSI